MTSMNETAEGFFVACETGKGWEGCEQYCHAGATFSAQSDALASVDTLKAYTAWMKGLLIPVPDGRYELRSFAVDEERHNVAAYGVFRGTHTGEGGCSVLSALQNGDLSEARYQSYLKLLKESEHYQMSYVEKRKKDKKFGQFIKSVMKHNKKK